MAGGTGCAPVFRVAAGCVPRTHLTTVPINYAAYGSTPRACLFKAPHIRHWAELRCLASPQGVDRVACYCHGCAQETVLYSGGARRPDEHHPGREESWRMHQGPR
jgi:hypothetical protein